MGSAGLTQHKLCSLRNATAAIEAHCDQIRGGGAFVVSRDAEQYIHIYIPGCVHKVLRVGQLPVVVWSRGAVVFVD